MQSSHPLRKGARSRDTAWLLAAISAIEEELEHRLKMDAEFVWFAEVLSSLYSQTEEFIRPRMVEEDR